MSFNKGKRSEVSLISLDIDPASIFSLSKGVIFNTIIHNIKQTLSNRHLNSLPWQVSGMYLICDPDRNKRFLDKLQKMQCVLSSISTQTYHSKLYISHSGVLTTPGRRICSHKKLTGITISRSIDELLHIESKSIVHLIQYKVLLYEHIPTLEIINEPGLSFKTIFDFDLTENNHFPRQLLPIAIIGLTREENCDLYLSIRNFFESDDHKIFDKSYLVDRTNIELCEEERQGINLPKKTTSTEVSTLEKFQCSVQLDRIDLSLYNVSNLPSDSNQSIGNKKRSKRPSLPPEYHCSLLLPRVDLSMYGINQPAMRMGIETNELLSEQQTNLTNNQELPPCDHDPVLSSIQNNDMNTMYEDCLIIVQCTDEEDDIAECLLDLIGCVLTQVHNDSISLNPRHLSKSTSTPHSIPEQNKIHQITTLAQYDTYTPLLSLSILVSNIFDNQ